MTYTLNRIRGKRGEVLKDIEGVKGVTLDLGKERVALVFLNENVIAEMKVIRSSKLTPWGFISAGPRRWASTS